MWLMLSCELRLLSRSHLHSKQSGINRRASENSVRHDEPCIESVGGPNATASSLTKQSLQVIGAFCVTIFVTVTERDAT